MFREGPTEAGITDHKMINPMKNEKTQQDPEGQQERAALAKQRGEVDLSVEVVLLLVFGMFFVLYGLLVFPMYAGVLPYSPDSTDGLFLVLVSLQIITMGKTPFGDLRRSWIVVLIGTALAMLGCVAVFIPGPLTALVRVLAGVILVFGGISLIVQLFISKDKGKTWMKAGGILRQLTIALSIVYVLMVPVGIISLVGAVVLVPGITEGPLVGVLLLAFGISFFYLAWCIHKATSLSLPEETKATITVIK